MFSIIQSETTNRSSPFAVLRRRVLLGVVFLCGIFSVQHRTDYCMSVVIRDFNVAVSNDGDIGEFGAGSRVNTQLIR
jgi:hypothetical protein